MSRQERIECVRGHIAELQDQAHEERAAHEASCPKCQSSGGPFRCLKVLSLTPEQKHGDALSFLRSLIGSEERDETYAQKAGLHPVNYKQHIDGFCSYWQNLRHRKFEAVGWKCERCGSDGNGSLDAHHLHYDTVGFEELHDLQALCRKCHKHADQVREASTRYSNAADIYMRKKYGDDYQWSESAEEEFDRWLERKQERGY
jgi:hypothetical protein